MGLVSFVLLDATGFPRFFPNRELGNQYANANGLHEVQSCEVFKRDNEWWISTQGGINCLLDQYYTDPVEPMANGPWNEEEWAPKDSVQPHYISMPG